MTEQTERETLEALCDCPFSGPTVRRLLELPSVERRGFCFGLAAAASFHDSVSDFLGGAGWWRYTFPGEGERDGKAARNHREYASDLRALAGRCEQAAAIAAKGAADA